MIRVARRVAAGALAVGTVLAIFAPPASAHAALTDANPKKDSSIASPSQVVLTYSDPIRLPRVILTDASGKERQVGAPQAVDNKVTQQVGGTLPNGKYTVGWRVVSADGHPVSGTYTFTVTGSSDAAAQPAAPAPTQTGTASTEDSDDGSSGWLWIGLITLVVVVAGGAVALMRRSTSSKN
ncbi:copper resistance protein CopC [Actinomadura meridiana]|uniref:Copper resistance protein CopC n=1 Tax=Actinomadura meridiana TaxID=559626 RepID=A0ABP8CIB0_9ACTN